MKKNNFFVDNSISIQVEERGGAFLGPLLYSELDKRLSIQNPWNLVS